MRTVVKNLMQKQAINRFRTLTASAIHPLSTIPFLMGLENSLMSETAIVDSTSTNILILSKQNMEI
jgi:hypothetical protein